MNSQPSLPNFFIIGTPKSGTTTLHGLLSAAPDIHMSSVKEPGYFWSERQYARGLDYYSKTFFSGGSAPTRGEATPWYFYHPKAVARIKSDLPEGAWRFIVLFRDPVDRAYSMYHDQVRAGIENLGFEDALDAEASRTAAGYAPARNPLAHQYFECGRYAKYLKIWLEAFGPDRILPLLLSDLQSDQANAQAEVRRFLGLNESTQVMAVTHSNHGGAARSASLQRVMNSILSARLVQRFGTSIVPARIYRPVWAKLGAWNRKRADIPPIDSRIANRMRSQYETETKELAAMINRDLDSWTSPR